METLYSEIKLCPLANKDVEAILSILRGETSVGTVGEAYGQTNFTFDGDGDILKISCEGLTVDQRSKDELNRLFSRTIVQAIASSTAKLELIINECHLVTSTIVTIAEALRENRSLVGFNIQNNPGNDEIGSVALKYACIQTMAPIQWYQGAPLDVHIEESRAQILAMFDGKKKNGGRKLSKTVIENDFIDENSLEAYQTPVSTPPIPVMHLKRPTIQGLEPAGKMRRCATEPEILGVRLISEKLPIGLGIKSYAPHQASQQNYLR